MHPQIMEDKAGKKIKNKYIKANTKYLTNTH